MIHFLFVWFRFGSLVSGFTIVIVTNVSLKFKKWTYPLLFSSGHILLLIIYLYICASILIE